MHWTLLTLISLSAFCIFANAVQCVMVGSVRTSGLLVCGAWTLQQLHWTETGTDSITLFLACDAALVTYLLNRRTDWRERIILYTIPLTTALTTYAHFYEVTVMGWWINWYIVVAQMVLGLPTPAFQPASGTVSHGMLRRASSEGA